MWNNYIKQILNITDINNEKYCNDFSKLFNLKLYSYHETIEFLKEGFDLYPESANINKYFNESHIEKIISIILYKEKIFSCFNIEHDNIFLLLNYDGEKILSNNTNTLSYLFMYFLFDINKRNLLYDIENKPLISNINITNEHQEMLIFLMKEYHKEDFSLLCLNYNFNLYLIESFLDKSTVSFNEETIWETSLPLTKIDILLNNNCGFINFLEYRNKNLFYTFESLDIYLNYYEKKYLYNKINGNVEYKLNEEKLINKI